ncbi:MAG: 50S ribosomal protein L25, partial [Blastocatellia bacterium]
TSFNVPLRVVGEPEGVRIADGVLDVITHHLEIRCLPAALPESITVDISSLAVGTHIKASDLKLGEGIELITDGEAIIATCISPRAAAESSAEAPAEPEVIKKGKTEE